MFVFLSNLIINIVIAIISEKVVVDAGKKLLAKGVASATSGIGIDEEDANDIVDIVAKSILNSHTR